MCIYQASHKNLPFRNEEYAVIIGKYIRSHFLYALILWHDISPDNAEWSISAVLETAGVPVTGGPPMLMSNAIYFSWRSIYGFVII